MQAVIVKPSLTGGFVQLFDTNEDAVSFIGKIYDQYKGDNKYKIDYAKDYLSVTMEEYDKDPVYTEWIIYPVLK